jgi:hypothetical protein
VSTDIPEGNADKPEDEEPVEKDEKPVEEGPAKKRKRRLAPLLAVRTSMDKVRSLVCYLL